jgi:uncharacterized protein (DUF1499 family)
MTLGSRAKDRLEGRLRRLSRAFGQIPLALLSIVLSGFLWLGLTPSAIAQSIAPYPPLHLTHPSAMALFSFPGNAPTNLGVKDGKLLACPGSPNCVSSQTPAADAEHAIAPMAYTGSAGEAIAKLKTIVQGMERTKVINASGDYLYAEFSTKLMGFVDDVEFYADDAAKVIHVRSASRLGQSDLGVNRQRVEAIRAQFVG